MAQGENTVFDNDAKSVKVNLLYSVAARQVAYVEKFLGITAQAGDSGDVATLTMDQRGYQLTVPSGLAVAKGDFIYIDVTDLTGHTPDDTAYSISSGGSKVKFAKAMEAKDSNNVVIVRLCADL